MENEKKNYNRDLCVRKNVKVFVPSHNQQKKNNGNISFGLSGLLVFVLYCIVFGILVFISGKIIFVSMNSKSYKKKKNI